MDWDSIQKGLVQNLKIISDHRDGRFSFDDTSSAFACQWSKNSEAIFEV